MTPLEFMLADLEGSRLEVVLAPSKRGGRDWDMIRVAANKNCAWYRSFCARHPSGRTRKNNCPDTRIKRRNTLRALRAMIAQKPGGIYEAELHRIAEKKYRQYSIDRSAAG